MRKMIRGMFLFCIVCLLFGCAAVPVSNNINYQVMDEKFMVYHPLDSTWEKLVSFATEHYTVLNQFKSPTEGTIKVKMINASLTTLDEKSSRRKDSSAIAIAGTRQRINNNNLVYPKTGDFECLFSINKDTDSSCHITVSMDRSCTVTSYYQNTFVVKRPLPNIKIVSSGVMEDKLKKRVN